MASDVDHFFMCLFAISTSYLVMCLFRHVPHLLFRFFCLLLNFEKSLCILDGSYLSEICSTKIFSQSRACHLFFS